MKRSDLLGKIALGEDSKEELRRLFQFTNQFHATNYLDTEDFSGPLPKLFEGALAFVTRNLHKVQAGRGRVWALQIPDKPE